MGNKRFFQMCLLDIMNVPIFYFYSCACTVSGGLLIGWKWLRQCKMLGIDMLVGISNVFSMTSYLFSVYKHNAFTPNCDS